MPSLGREKLMRFSRPKAPSGGKSSRRRRGSPIAATKRRRPSANWSAPRRTCCGLGTNWRNWSSSAPPCRPRRNRPRPTWPCGRSCGCWKSPFGWTSWTSSVPRVRPWKRIWPRPAGAGELLCPGRSALCQGGDPFAASCGTSQAQAEALRAQFQDNEAQLRDNRQRVELLRDRVRANEAGAQRTQADLAQQQSRRQALEADLARRRPS